MVAKISTFGRAITDRGTYTILGVPNGPGKTETGLKDNGPVLNNRI